MSESKRESIRVPDPPPLKKQKRKCYFKKRWVQDFKGIARNFKGLHNNSL